MQGSAECIWLMKSRNLYFKNKKNCGICETRPNEKQGLADVVMKPYSMGEFFYPSVLHGGY